MQEPNILQNVSIFPNPAETQINIQSNIDIVDINIYDMTGKRVLCHSNLHSNHHSLDIDLLSEGL
ncbi:MAG TPA: hypothetical protein DCL86_01430 [Bacteroidales bacterium]|nr:hypothetical protein [Bacteroidales bacterium]